MALEGTIKDFGLADILQLIGIQRKTGILTLEGEDDTVTIKFLDGQVVGADTLQRNLEDLLGSVLVRTGRITDAQLQEALRIQKSTLQRLGYILVKQRFISQEDLVDALRIQVTQIVYRLFRWKNGKYQFAAMDHVEYDSEHFQPLSAETILMEGARMIDEWPIIERRIRSASLMFRKTEAGAALDVPVTSLLETDIDFGFDGTAAGGGGDPEEITLSAEERDVLHMVDGASTVQDLVDTSPLGEFDVYRILYDLVSRNLIAEIKPSVIAGAAPESPTRGRILSYALQALVLAVAVAGALTLPMNGWTPWRIAGRGPETQLLLTYDSRSRIERLERAVQIYFLDRGVMPDDLAVLARGGYLHAGDVVDPWGRPYDLRVDATGFEISGAGPGGEPRDDLRVRQPFTAAERMVLEGGAAERARTDDR
jgi:Domain of unknown function (DUF4388)